MIFETTRLTVRHLLLDDYSPFCILQCNKKVMKYTGHKSMTKEECLSDLSRVIHLYDQPESYYYVWAVERKADNCFAGTCAVVRNDNNEYEIGFRFLEEYWGNGYGIEITEGLIDYAFQVARLNHLVTYVDIRNTVSMNVLDRSRFVFIREIANKKENCTDRFYKIESAEP